MPKFYKSKIWYPGEAKERIQKKAFEAGEKAKHQNQAKLFKQGYGYNDIREMRNAFVSRIKTKVAFTEKL